MIEAYRVEHPRGARGPKKMRRAAIGWGDVHRDRELRGLRPTGGRVAGRGRRRAGGAS